MNQVAAPQKPQMLNDRTAPRWLVSTINCAVLIGNSWQTMAVVDVSLTGIKVMGTWDASQAITAITLTDAGHAPLTGEIVMLAGDMVWANPSRTVGGIHFDVPSRDIARRLFRFLSLHIADGTRR